jgi:hypothetical protein
VFTELVD